MLDEYPETLIGVEWHSPSFTPGNSDFIYPHTVQELIFMVLEEYHIPNGVVNMRQLVDTLMVTGKL